MTDVLMLALAFGFFALAISYTALSSQFFGKYGFVSHWFI
jgi:hypothetical protein